MDEGSFSYAALVVRARSIDLTWIYPFIHPLEFNVEASSSLYQEQPKTTCFNARANITLKILNTFLGNVCDDGADG